MKTLIRRAAFVVGMAAVSIAAAAQSVRIDELASYKPPFAIVEGAVAQMPNGDVYGLYTGGTNGGIYRVTPNGSGGYATTLAYEFGAGESRPVNPFRLNGVVGNVIAAAPDGSVYFAGSQGLMRFDPATVTVTLIHALSSQSVMSVIVSNDGQAVFTAQRDGKTFRHDIASGAHRELASTGSDLSGIAQMNDGNLLVAHDKIFSTREAVLHRVDPLTGAVTGTIVRSLSSMLPPTKGDDGQVYAWISEFGDRYTYRIEPSCFCLQTMHLIPWPNSVFISSIVGPRNGYMYLNIAGGPHRMNLNASPVTVERIAVSSAYAYRLLPDGTLAMFGQDNSSVSYADAIDVDTVVAGTDATVAPFTRALVNDGMAGFPTQWTEGADGMLYGLAASYVREGAIVRIDPITKARAVVADVDFGDLFHSNGGIQTGRMVRAQNGTLYGTYTTYANYTSAIFSFDPATNAFAILKTFPMDQNGLPGPDGGLVSRVYLGSDGWLYGAAQWGSVEPTYDGHFFKFDPSSGAFVVLASMTLPDGFYPAGAMVEVSAGTWYASFYTYTGATCGALGRLDANSGTFVEVRRYDRDAGDPCEPDGLTRSADGTIYGIFKHGGPEAVPGDYLTQTQGGIFSIDPATNVATTRYLFPPGNAGYPLPDAIAAPDGKVYVSFMKYVGPSVNYQKGLVRFDPSTGAVSMVIELPDTAGYLSDGAPLNLGSDGRFSLGHSSPFKAFSIAVLDAIAVAPASGPFGGTTTLSATLKAVGVPLAGRTISFTLNGASIGSAITNANGVATLGNVSLTGIGVGTHAGVVGASFAGDDFFPTTSGSGPVTVIDVPTPGLTVGAGYIQNGTTKYDFAFLATELPNGSDLGLFGVSVLTQDPRPRQSHRWREQSAFTSTNITMLRFDSAGVTFGGTGRWNGRSGYRFEARAIDSSRRHRGSLRVTVYDSSNNVVLTFDDELDGGVIESLRLR